MHHQDRIQGALRDHVEVQSKNVKKGNEGQEIPNVGGGEGGSCEGSVVHHAGRWPGDGKVFRNR